MSIIVSAIPAICLLFLLQWIFLSVRWVEDGHGSKTLYLIYYLVVMLLCVVPGLVTATSLDTDFWGLVSHHIGYTISVQFIANGTFRFLFRVLMLRFAKKRHEAGQWPSPPPSYEYFEKYLTELQVINVGLIVISIIVMQLANTGAKGIVATAFAAILGAISVFVVNIVPNSVVESTKMVIRKLQNKSG